MNPFAPTTGTFHRSTVPIFKFNQFKEFFCINTNHETRHREDKYVLKAPQHTLKPRARSCSLTRTIGERVCGLGKRQKPPFRAPPIAHQPTFHGEVLASLKVLLRSHQSPKRLPEQNVYKRCCTLLYLSELPPF